MVAYGIVQSVVSALILLLTSTEILACTPIASPDQQNPTVCHSAAQAQPVSVRADVQPGIAEGTGTFAAHDLEPQERAAVAPADSQVQPGSPRAPQPEKEAVEYSNW